MEKQKTITRTCKLFLTYRESLNDMSYANFKKVYNEIQKENYQAKNEVSERVYQHLGYKNIYKKDYGKPLDDKDAIGYKMFNSYLYDSFKNTYWKSNTGNLSSLIQSTVSKCKDDYNKILYHKDNKSGCMPVYNCTQPVELYNKSIEINYIDKKYRIALSLVSSKYNKELSHKGKFIFEIKPNKLGKYEKEILNNILDKNTGYKYCASKFRMDTKGICLMLCYQMPFEEEKHIHDSNISMGIDLGIAIPAVWSIYHSDSKYYDDIDKYGSKETDKITTHEIDEFRRKIQARRKLIASNTKYIGGCSGHGYKSKFKNLNKIKDKESRFAKTCNYKYARAIVNSAVKHNASVIQMEDLTGISKKNKFLKNWNYYDLQNKIKMAAEKEGIAVKLINPKCTSQRCHVCGCINPDNRIEQAAFKCVKCGTELNADKNASMNIAIPNIDKIIKGEN